MINDEIFKSASLNNKERFKANMKGGIAGGAALAAPGAIGAAIATRGRVGAGHLVRGAGYGAAAGLGAQAAGQRALRHKQGKKWLKNEPLSKAAGNGGSLKAFSTGSASNGNPHAALSMQGGKKDSNDGSVFQSGRGKMTPVSAYAYSRSYGERSRYGSGKGPLAASLEHGKKGANNPIAKNAEIFKAFSTQTKRRVGAGVATAVGAGLAYKGAGRLDRGIRQAARGTHMIHGSRGSYGHADVAEGYGKIKSGAVMTGFGVGAGAGGAHLAQHYKKKS